MKNDNPLCRLRAAGQSAWLDFITRDLVRSGKLRELIEENCICGMTTNPTIFEKAIAGSSEYDTALTEAMKTCAGKIEVYRQLLIDDVTEAARLFEPLHEESGGRDGYVSIEVSPEYARDASKTIAEAIELDSEANHRPNILIKVPGTLEGLEAIRELTSRGLSINVTLLFSAEQYLKAADAFLAGLEDRAGRGEPVDSIFSVASLFLSRIDTAADAWIDEALAAGKGPAEDLKSLRGTLAIATAVETLEAQKHILHGPRWAALEKAGAWGQKLLWASTGTKDQAYSDVKYVEELIEPDTVNTMPLATIEAFADHGRVDRLSRPQPDEAERRLRRARDLGLNMDDLYDELQREGVEKFTVSYARLLDLIEEKCGGTAAA